MQLKPCQRCCCRTSGKLGEGEWSLALLTPESQIFTLFLTFPNHVVCILLLSAFLVSVWTLGSQRSEKSYTRCLTLGTISAKCLAFRTHWEVDHMAFVQLHFAAWICLDAKEYSIERQREGDRFGSIWSITSPACRWGRQSSNCSSWTSHGFLLGFEAKLLCWFVHS